MGLRGPAPKPTELRRLEGNQAKRPLPEEAPYPSGIPEKPGTLSEAAAPIWDELVEQIAPSGVFCLTDGGALAQLSEDQALLEAGYAGIWSIVDSLNKKAAERGVALHGGALLSFLSGTSGRRAMAAINTIAARVIVERREFGLTPAARTRIANPDAMGSAGMTFDALEKKLCG